MEIALAAFLIAVTIGLFAVWRSQERDPGAWQRRLHERRWLRALAWTACLTAAGALGAALGGSGELSLFVAVCGGVVALLLFILWSYARAFGSRDDSE